MKNEYLKSSVIGLVKETESPENPGALEKRVALIPKDIKVLVDQGYSLFVESGAGEDIGYSDKEYINAGAIIENGEEIYLNKDMIIKFKGASLENIKKMKPGTILFCMAHFASFPDRAKLLKDCQINVIAMEEILESPKEILDEIIISKCFAEEVLKNQKHEHAELEIGFLGYSNSMIGAIRRSGNRNAHTMTLYQRDVELSEICCLNDKAIYFYDSKIFTNKALLLELEKRSCHIYDLQKYIQEKVPKVVKEYREKHPPFEFGGRRIQCLHETGMAGARYGFKLSKENNQESTKSKSCVLGYGNVGMGAIHECYDQGCRVIKILGRFHTLSENIASFLKDAEVIINGAEQAAELRGKNYLIKSDYVGELIQKGSVVIDLVGGSASNRSPVEDIIECSYLTDPHFERDGVFFSGLWGWPMMGMMKESADKYSGQILDVLLRREKILEGLGDLSPGIKRALVCGPFDRD